MKKIYITPAIQVRRIQTASFIASSGLGYGGGNGGSGTPHNADSKLGDFLNFDGNGEEY